MPSSGYVQLSSSGCLLPALIIANLLFGKLIFNSTGLWLGVEAVLVLIFILKVRLMVSRISRLFRAENPGGDFSRQKNHKPAGRIIDVQGQEVDEHKQLD
ncbi:MAG: hypothetical protein PHS66_02385 [Candidatus Omnitrophica bacterium]|nr:hypothetical protein [Candidatus Omnitrophota bacterium]